MGYYEALSIHGFQGLIGLGLGKMIATAFNNLSPLS